MQTSLLRGIRRWDLVAFGINFVVGAGIFGLPSKVYGLSGSASLYALLICAVAMTLIAFCFAEVGSRFIESGGPYLFAREAFGPFVGFETGWLRTLTGVTSFAANSNLLVDYLGYVFPAVSVAPWRPLIIANVALSLTVINVIGVRRSALLSNFLAISKLLPLLLFIAVGLLFVDRHNFAGGARPSLGSVSMSVLLLVHAFSGFESVTIAAGEIRSPQRSVPFALFVTIGFVTLLYLLIQFVCIGTLPGLAVSTRPLADAGSRFLSYGGYIITAGAAVSILGNLNAQLLVTTRTVFAMAERKQLPQLLSAIHNRFRTPYITILISSMVMLAFALSGTFIQLLTISVMARLFVYATTCAALPVLRRRPDARPRTFRAPLGNGAAAVSMVLCVWLLFNSTKHDAWKTVIAASAGLILYNLFNLWKSYRRESVASQQEPVEN